MGQPSRSKRQFVDERGTTGSRRWRPSIALIVAAVAAVAVAGCGSSSNGSGSGSTTNTSGSTGKRVAVTFLDTGATTYNLALESAARAAAAKDNIALNIQDANFDPTTQLAQCRTALASGHPNALLIYAVDNASMIPCVTEAIHQGVKVGSIEGQIGPKFCVPNGPQIKGMTVEVYQCASQQADYYAKLLLGACANKNPCNVAYLSGPPSYEEVAAETGILQQITAAHPSIHVIAHAAPGYDAPAAGFADTKTLLLKDPQTNVIFDDDSTASGVVRALQSLGKTDTVKVVGSGANMAAVARIKAGTEYGTLPTFPRTDATYGLTSLAKAVRGQHIAVPEQLMSNISPLGKGVFTLTKANVGNYSGEW